MSLMCGTAQEKIDHFERTVMDGCPVFTNAQREAAHVLEQHGQRFLIEYGYGNCESKARDYGWVTPVDQRFFRTLFRKIQ